MIRSAEKLRYSKAIFYYGINTGVLSLIGFLANLLFARYFGLKIVGQYTLLISFTSVFFAIVTFGLLSGISREATWYVANKKNMGGFLLAVYIVILLSTIFFAFPFGILAKHLLTTKYHSSQLFYPLLYIELVYIFVFIPLMLLKTSFECYRVIHPVVIGNLTSGIIKILILVFSFLVGYQIVTAITIIYFIPNIILFVIFFIYAYKLLGVRFHNFDIKETLLHLKNVINYSLKFLPVTFSELIIANIAYLIIGKYLNFSDLGEYKIVFSIFILLTTLPALVGKVLLPTLTQLYFKKKYESIYNYFVVSLKLSLTIMVPILVYIIIFSKDILSLYGIRSHEAQVSFIILLVANFLLSGNFIGSLLGAYDKPARISLYLLIGAILNLAFSFVLIPIFGIIGAAISSFICYLISQILLYKYSFNQLMKKNFSFKIYFLPLVHGLIMIILMMLINLLWLNITSNILSALLGGGVYLLLNMRYNTFTTEEIVQVKSVIDEIKSGPIKNSLMWILSAVKAN